MNIINCEKCGTLFDKDVLIFNLSKENEKREYLRRTCYFPCPVCKQEFYFVGE